MTPRRASNLVTRSLLGASALVAALTPTTASEARAQEAVRPLRLADYMDMESVGDPRISPDGTRIVFTRGWIDPVNDRRRSSLWVMNADGSRKAHLLDGSGARWSPDGTRIAYTAPGEPSGSQIFVRWMDAEGATTQITRLENGPSGIAWSPDGEWIAFTSRVDDRADFAGVDLPPRPDGAEWTAEPKVVERASYRRDRQGYVDTGWSHVFVVPAEGGTPRQLTDGDWNHGSIAWSADGDEIFFSSHRVADADRPEHWQESEIYAVDVASGAIRQLTERAGPDGNPVPSPDGTLVAYTGQDAHDDTYRNGQILVMAPDGTGTRVVSGDYDGQVSGLQWAPDGGGLYFNAEREGYENVYYVSVDGGGVRPVTEGAHMLSLDTFADDGTAVGTLSTAWEPGDVYRFDLEAPDARTRLTEVNADILAGVTLGQVEEIWYDSEDGFRIQGWIVKPP
ncbi:MAG TPA: DPP IV N-terminal domain-containing protein, partial [Longimicrobiales bacterium]|nr:DPP IV N-terminal domain-containing protein [Longimicrobiales bacterium]